jgi:peptidoglycan-N-acetylglucosamine deacetylase
MSQLGCVSVDLDSLSHYCHIQGLSPDILSDHARALVATKAIPRLCELFSHLNLAATFFVVGRDIELPHMSAALAKANEQGIELANHSYSHHYSMSSWRTEAIIEDITRAQNEIEKISHLRPKGFRAPGYTVSASMVAAIESLKFEYASSTFPAVPYYLAKASVMGILRALRRPSKAMLDSPAVLLAPTRAYRPSHENPYQKGSARYLELPISVTPFSRLPVIGTFVSMMPEPVVTMSIHALKNEPLFNFEWHAIDVLDVTDGIPEILARQQRDLLIPAAKKIARFKKILTQLRDAREWVTLATAAQALKISVPFHG